jgi:hypothetical protein
LRIRRASRATDLPERDEPAVAAVPEEQQAAAVSRRMRERKNHQHRRASHLNAGLETVSRSASGEQPALPLVAAQEQQQQQQVSAPWALVEQPEAKSPTPCAAAVVAAAAAAVGLTRKYQQCWTAQAVAARLMPTEEAALTGMLPA